MLFKRAQITSYGNELTQRGAAGLGEVSNLSVKTIATDANAVLTVADLSGGVVQFTGFTAGRTITVPTAALILAAAPDMDIGDSFSLTISVVPAFAGTYVTAAGVTLAGRATVPAASSTYVVVTKTSATTVTWTAL